MLHKLRRAMVNPDRTQLSGAVDVDESAVPYKRKEDTLKKRGGSSVAHQLWITAAVETHGKHGVGRIRIARIADRSAASIAPFVVANTVPGTRLRTDALASYSKVPDRPLKMVNIKKTGLPAHIVFKWIHTVFSNLKRWALGTFHGFREKHLDSYLNEFVFRWNRRRNFQGTMDTMLGIGRRIGRVTYRDIVGDTTQWKKEHIEEILDMCHPNKQKIVSDLADLYRVHRLEVLENIVWWVKRLREEHPDLLYGFEWDFDGVREFEEPRYYGRRTKASRPVLVPRRPGEERRTSRRYTNPAALLPRILPRPVQAAALAAE